MVYEALLTISKHLVLPLLFVALAFGYFLHRKDKEKIKSQYTAYVSGTIFTILVVSALIIGTLIAGFLVYIGTLGFLIDISSLDSIIKVLKKPFLNFWNVFYGVFAFLIGLQLIQNKKGNKNSLRDISFSVFSLMVVLGIIFLITSIASLFSEYRDFISYKMFIFTFYIFLMVLVVFLIFKYYLFKRMKFIIFNLTKVGTVTLFFSVLLFYLLNQFYLLPHLDVNESIEGYVINSVYSSNEQFAEIKTTYQIKNLGIYGWLPLKFNLNIEDSNAQNFFDIYINTTSNKKNLINRYLGKNEYKLSDGNVTKIFIPSNYAILLFNAKSLKEINVTSFVIEGYRNVDVEDNFSFKKIGTFCEPYENNISLCITDIQISNRYDKNLQINQNIINNYKTSHGYDPAKCGFGNMTVSYSGNDTIRFEKNCNKDYGCETPNDISLFNIILIYSEPALFAREIRFTEKADLNISVEFFCSK